MCTELNKRVWYPTSDNHPEDSAETVTSPRDLDQINGLSVDTTNMEVDSPELSTVTNTLEENMGQISEEDHNGNEPRLQNEGVLLCIELGKVTHTDKVQDYPLCSGQKMGW